jgi:hypothetical protein
MLDIPEEENQERLKEVLDFSEIGEYFEQPVRTYNSGMRLRLAFANRGFFLHAKHLFKTTFESSATPERGKAYAQRSRLDWTSTPEAIPWGLTLSPFLVWHSRMENWRFAAFELHQQRICSTKRILAFTVAFSSHRHGAEFSHLGLFDLATRMSLEPVGG